MSFIGSALSFVESLTVKDATGSTVILPANEPGYSPDFVNALILLDSTGEAEKL